MAERSERIPVTMTEREFEICCQVAMRRHAAGIFAHADAHKYGYDGSDPLGLHLSGCVGECSVAKGLNVYWSGMGTSWHEDEDVGYYQARWTEHDTGHLLVYPHDIVKFPKRPWVLVVGSIPRLYICGWIYGEQAAGYPLRETEGRKPAHWIPQQNLWSMRVEA